MACGAGTQEPPRAAAQAVRTAGPGRSQGGTTPCRPQPLAQALCGGTFQLRTGKDHAGQTREGQVFILGEIKEGREAPSSVTDARPAQPSPEELRLAYCAGGPLTRARTENFCAPVSDLRKSGSGGIEVRDPGRLTDILKTL